MIFAITYRRDGSEQLHAEEVEGQQKQAFDRAREISAQPDVSGWAEVRNADGWSHATIAMAQDGKLFL